MSRNVRQVSIAACGLLVLLRVAIGWQFLYEGLWKLNSQKTSRPWSAEAYLQNARGPLRDYFRGMLEDPDGVARLEFDYVEQKWADWRRRFEEHYADLSDQQKRQISVLVDGPGEFRQPLAALPEGVDLEKFKPRRYKAPKGWFFRYDEKAKRLVTNLHLVPEERESLINLARPAPARDLDSEVEEATAPGTAPAEWVEAIEKLCDRTSKLSLLERLQVLLIEDYSRTGQVFEAHAGTIDHTRKGEKQVYLHLLERYNADLARARQAFHHEHLESQWAKIQEERAKLVGPVDALTLEFQTALYRVLEPAQAARGPVPERPSRYYPPDLRAVNVVTMCGLATLGLLLMVGLFTRLAALGGAALLVLFYLPMPPWPGVPELPGPEHSLIVNKNIIEAIACLALAALPTGRWVGFDALVRRFILRRKTD